MTRVPRLHRITPEADAICDWCGGQVWATDVAFVTLGHAHTMCSARCGQKVVEEIAAVERWSSVVPARTFVEKYVLPEARPVARLVIG